MKSAATMMATLAALMILTSCGIDFKTRAVDKARNYALENLKQLSEPQRDFIRYTDPVIMDRVIYRLRGSNDMMHTCMVWTVPGMGDASVVVAGHGERSLLEWCPDRIVIEDMKGPDALLANATTNAITFVMSRMLHLSDHERNRVRFTPPEVYATNFDVDAEEVKENEKPLSRWEAYMKAKERKAQPVQYSFAWKAEPDSERIVVCGYSTKKGLVGWKAVEGMKIKAAELDAAKLSGNIASLLPEEEAPKAAGLPGKAK